MGNKNNSQIGREGEEEASVFLIKNGFKILKRNYRFSSGEIDIIAQSGKEIIFVEVKSSNVFKEDYLEYSINSRKQARIIDAAKNFLLDFPEYSECMMRFDIIFISRKEEKIVHIKSAFNGIG